MWWKSQKVLPLTTGAYAPATVDWIVGYGETSTFSRLYYPSDLPKEQNDSTKWYRWLPHEKYIDGFASIVNTWGSLIRLAVWFNGGEPLVPAQWAQPPNKHSAGGKMPVVVFSHGFGATRFLSATLASELASHGFFVACIEHKDTSAGATYYYESEESKLADEKVWIPHVRMEFGPDHYAIRNKQIKVRVTEIKKLLEHIEELNQGTATNLLPEMDPKWFQDRLDLSKISMMGHSFGGATTLLTMASDERIKCGVILDGWMFPIKEEQLNLSARPILFINTQTFHIKSNLDAMDKILVQREDAEKEVFTIMRTTHESQTDTPHVMGYWLNWFMPKLDPTVGTFINNFLSIKFLTKHLGVNNDGEEAMNDYLEKHKSSYIKGTFIYSKEPTRKFKL